jgi:DNA-binding transcriptional ArsR family regulator
MTIMDEDFCARQLKVLADRTRLNILSLLMRGSQNVSELNQHLQVEQSLLSHHLKILRQAGFVQSRRVGKVVLYEITTPLQSPDRLNGLNLGCCTLSFD